MNRGVLMVLAAVIPLAFFTACDKLGEANSHKDNRVADATFWSGVDCEKAMIADFTDGYHAENKSAFVSRFAQSPDECSVVFAEVKDGALSLKGKKIPLTRLRFSMYVDTHPLPKCFGITTPIKHLNIKVNVEGQNREIFNLHFIARWMNGRLCVGVYGSTQKYDRAPSQTFLCIKNICGPTIREVATAILMAASAYGGYAIASSSMWQNIASSASPRIFSSLATMANCNSQCSAMTGVPDKAE